MELFASQNLFELQSESKLTLKEASKWASRFTGKNVTSSNIAYLIQYGRIQKYGENGNTLVSLKELQEYYSSFTSQRELEWKEILGEDLNWNLSFEKYKEAETTKHVHRLHPYKGKFIPQLVEYFLDSHTDTFKKEIFFEKGDVILDPFCGSGTTLVQANELGIHAIGIDISEFNSLISNCKIQSYDLQKLERILQEITYQFKHYLQNSRVIEFDEALSQLLLEFNEKYFPVPEYKYKLKKKQINEDVYGKEKEELFLKTYSQLLKKYKIELKQNTQKKFIDKWYIKPIREEIEFIYKEIEKIKEENLQDIAKVILSRTIRSCRATTHADLSTLKEPVTAPYYCAKHGKVCKPLFSISKWWQTYTKDTLKRLSEFQKLKTNTHQICVTGDSRTIDLFEILKIKAPKLEKIVKHQKIKGIFSSPPYVGLIDYHEQHAYAYDLFGFKRKDELEIGPLFKGQGKEARDSYVQGIVQVLLNCKKYLTDNYHVFLVANDKYNLYPTIAERSNMKIVNQFKRPVLNRTEKDKGAYAEIIFHLREK